MHEDRRAYRAKLLDPRWQRVRLQVFARDRWSCVACGATWRTLHVHHLRYQPGKEPWESPPDALATLCALCHRLVSRAAVGRVMAELNITVEHLREAARRVKSRLTAWEEQRRKTMAPRAAPTSAPFVSSCPNWRKLRPRAGRVWTPAEDEALLMEFDAGLTTAEIALILGRGAFAVEVRLCKLGRKL